MSETVSHPVSHPTDARGRELPVLPAGSYRHYKQGEVYQVIGLAHDANAPDRTLVVYMAPPGKSGPALAVRNLFPDPEHGDGSGFFDWVDPTTGALADPGTRWPLPFTSEHATAVAEGRDRPDRPSDVVRRFTYLGPVRP